jgi:heme oxygenase
MGVAPMPHPRSQTGAESLPVLLREATSVNHREAERRPFMRRFFRGEITREPYTAYLSRLWFVYTVLEEVGASLRDDPGVGAMWLPELARRERLENDLQFFAGADWRTTITPSPVAERYAERVRWAGQEAAPAWISHAWVRYMGMLGGQDTLRKLVAKGCEVTDNGGDDGLDFYRFPDIPDVKAFFADYHARMSSLPLDESSRQQVIDEGNRAFQLNMDITDEVAADYGIEAPAGAADELDQLKAGS